MRLFIDTVIALMLVGVLSGVVWRNQNSRSIQEVRETARMEVRRFQQQIDFQSALAEVHQNQRGYPATIEAGWFKGLLPANPLLEGGHPWVEVAGPDQKDFTHPPNRMAVTRSDAKFWYNPHTGSVRARVPAAMSDAATVELYNFVNDCHLPDLFADGN